MCYTFVMEAFHFENEIARVDYQGLFLDYDLVKEHVR